MQLKEILNKNNYDINNCIYFDEIILECLDMVLVLDWKYNHFYIRPDLYAALNKYCSLAFNLIKAEEEMGVSAIENTHYKSFPFI